MLVTLASIHYQDSKNDPPWRLLFLLGYLAALFLALGSSWALRLQTAVMRRLCLPHLHAHLSQTLCLGSLPMSASGPPLAPDHGGLGSRDLSAPVPQPVPPSERSVSPTATFLLFSHCYEKLNSTMNTCVLSFRIQKFLTFCHICWLTLYIYTVPKPSEGKFQAPYTSACSPM